MIDFIIILKQNKQKYIYIANVSSFIFSGKQVKKSTDFSASPQCFHVCLVLLFGFLCGLLGFRFGTKLVQGETRARTRFAPQNDSSARQFSNISRGCKQKVIYYCKATSIIIQLIAITCAINV